MTKLETRLQKLEAQQPAEDEMIIATVMFVSPGGAIDSGYSVAGSFDREDDETEEDFKSRITAETKAFMEANK